MTSAAHELDPAALYPTLTADQIALLRRFGETHTTRAGDVIWSVGERHPSLVVVLSGQVRAIDRSDGYDRTILEAGPGQFIGELSLLTGQIAWATCVVQEGGEVLIVPASRLRVAIATAPALGNILVTTLALRR
jgi:thioredoxin reductase (NADPH)